MNKYNYEEAVKHDIREYINDNIDIADYEDLEELEEYLNDVLWATDSVTGNASGSYTFNNWQAEENIAHNLDLLGEALSEFCCDPGFLTEQGAEACDVTIRCYILGYCIAEVIEEMR